MTGLDLPDGLFDTHATFADEQTRRWLRSLSEEDLEEKRKEARAADSKRFMLLVDALSGDWKASL